MYVTITTTGCSLVENKAGENTLHIQLLSLLSDGFLKNDLPALLIMHLSTAGETQYFEGLRRGEFYYASDAICILTCNQSKRQSA
jgi:hypothetical protein